MILQSTEPDNISLELAKAHLRVLHDLENELIQGYITASLGVVDDYLHDKALKSVYVNTTEELAPIDTVSNNIMLYLEQQPRNVVITSNLGTETLDKRHYTYSGNYILIPGVDGRTISEVLVDTGKFDHEAQIIQARLLLIGTYSEFRESIVPLRLSELPDGVKMILDNCSEGSI